MYPLCLQGSQLQYHCLSVDKMRVTVARNLTWLWLTSSLHTCGHYMAVALYKELCPVLGARRGGRAARLQESRAEAGVVAALRTEAQRMSVWDNCAERPRGRLCGTTVQRGPEDSYADRGAQRQRLACCLQTRSE